MKARQQRGPRYIVRWRHGKDHGERVVAARSERDALRVLKDRILKSLGGPFKVLEVRRIDRPATPPGGGR